MWRHLDVSLERKVFVSAKQSLCVPAYQPSLLGVPVVMSFPICSPLGDDLSQLKISAKIKNCTYCFRGHNEKPALS